MLECYYCGSQDLVDNGVMADEDDGPAREYICNCCHESTWVDEE